MPRRSTRLFWILHLVGWAGVFLLGYSSALAHGKPPSYWRAQLPQVVAGFVVTLGLRVILRRLSDRPPWQLVALMAPVVLAASTAIGLVYGFAFIDWCGEECRPGGTLGYVAYVATGVYEVMTWVAFYVGIKCFQRMRQESEAALAARAAAHLAQLRMLRYQLNPHFLFNTLNAITTLNLEGDTATANRVVERLSAFLRHSLHNDPMQRVTVLEEIRSLDLYLDIEKVRFAERLRVEVAIDPDCQGALVPALLLQPLVENVIKHAVARSVEGCTLRLEAHRDEDRLLLTVADDGPGCPANAIEESTGVGLRNTGERLRVLYGDKQSLELGRPAGGGCEVRLSLPFERREEPT